MKKNIICNCCGKEIHEGTELIKTDYLHVQKEWGYFSGKDGSMHEFYLCESCYDEMISHFEIPPNVTDITEFV